MELSRLLRCVYPDLAGAREDLAPLRPTPGPIVDRLRRMELSRLLRCVYPDLVGACLGRPSKLLREAV
jgi:hypothetical protein